MFWDFRSAPPVNQRWTRTSCAIGTDRRIARSAITLSSDLSGSCKFPPEYRREAKRARVCEVVAREVMGEEKPSEAGPASDLRPFCNRELGETCLYCSELAGDTRHGHFIQRTGIACKAYRYVIPIVSHTRDDQDASKASTDFAFVQSPRSRRLKHRR